MPIRRVKQEWVVKKWSIIPSYDIGELNDSWAQGKIRVPKKEWNDYIELRYQFERAHDRMALRIKRDRKASKLWMEYCWGDRPVKLHKGSMEELP